MIEGIILTIVLMLAPVGGDCPGAHIDPFTWETVCQHEPAVVWPEDIRRGEYELINASKAPR